VSDVDYRFKIAPLRRRIIENDDGTSDGGPDREGMRASVVREKPNGSVADEEDRREAGRPGRASGPHRERILLGRRRRSGGTRPPQVGERGKNELPALTSS
jgi:hypothetical protein